MKTIFIISLALAIALLYSFNSVAEPKVTLQTTTDSNGNLLVRYTTPGSEALTFEPVPPTNSNTDQEVLWMVEHATSIAENNAISGNGSIMVSGWWLNVERVSKYNVTGTGIPIWESSWNPSFQTPVSISDNGNVIAAAGDIEPLKVWLSGAGPAPSWTYTWPAGYQGVDCDVSDNGVYVVAICHQTGTNTGAKLFVFQANNPNPLVTVDFTATNQANGVEISETNNYILVTNYNSFLVYSMPAVTLIYTGTNYSQTMGGMDDDAEWIATGDFNGILHVYHRVGTTYTQAWTNTMGGWVTAVDISSDGSTVLAGNYTYSPANHGMARGFSITGTVLWSYSNYGDYVESVALSNDGSVGVAGSWGQYGGTFGDVFTAFTMSTGAVIFRLLDDIDEPGSIFEVAISDDGNYAVAGGKAVHAREFGNGGEVYSIELGTPGPFNVTIDLTPINPPIVIPATGGSFDYTVNIHNNETHPVTFDAWTSVTLPTGANVGPIILRPLTLGPGVTLIRNMTQGIPAGAPAGVYTYYGKVGDAPNTVWNQDSFQFTKSP